MKKRYIPIFIVLALWLMFSVAVWLTPDKDYSESERRSLSTLPSYSEDFSSDFEEYMQDQAPLRDALRTVKACAQYYLFGKMDNNELYVKDGYAAKIIYPYSEADVDNAGKRFNAIYEKYLKDTGSKVYMSFIPDKGAFMAEKYGYPHIDYNKMAGELSSKMPYAEYIDITGELSIENYYRTDTHWRQETLLGAANVLRKALGLNEAEAADYTLDIYTSEFSGVYRGQTALPLKKDTIYYITNDIIENCTVYDYQTKQNYGVYTPSLADRDKYSFFLCGSSPAVEITNPAGEEGKELIIFRDSFASSLTPWLIDGYSKITLVDIRYVSSAYLDSLIDFHGQDTLFMYSSLLINANRGVFK